MNKTENGTLLFFLGTAVLIGAAAYLFVNSQFEDDDFEFDTYDEHCDDYL